MLPRIESYVGYSSRQRTKNHKKSHTSGSRQTSSFGHSSSPTNAAAITDGYDRVRVPYHGYSSRRDADRRNKQPKTHQLPIRNAPEPTKFRSPLPAVSEDSFSSDEDLAFANNARSDSAPTNSSSCSVQIVPGRRENGCAVAAMAALTDGNYERVRDVAIRHGFRPGEGMFYRDAMGALEELNVKAEYGSTQPSRWSKFPHKALVSVLTNGGRHAVVLRGKQIYDNNKTKPLHRDNYSLCTGSYIKLD